jgi:LPS-assembly lipoprotein
MPHRSAPLQADLPRRRLLLTGLLAAALGGCGFHLRGPQRLEFASLHIGVGPYSDLGAELRRQIATTGSTVVVEEATQAEARLQVLSNVREREILSLSGAGKVREYRLQQRLRFQLVDKGGQTLIPPTEISAQREYSFDDAQVLGKAQEEALLYRDMQNDLTQQLMRRLAAFRRQP